MAAHRNAPKVLAPREPQAQEVLATEWSALRYGLLALAFAAAGLLALLIDKPVAQAALRFAEREIRFPGSSEVRRFIELSEAFAHGTGVAAILVGVLVLDRYRKRLVPRLAFLAYGAGLTADLIKLAVARIRPRAFDFSGSIGSSFSGALRPLDPGTFDYSSIQSFPSAHSATAVGLAIGLTRLYPQGRAYFATLAAFSCVQRIVASAHWPSDVLCGAAVGCFVAGALVSPRLAGRWFDRLE